MATKSSEDTLSISLENDNGIDDIRTRSVVLTLGNPVTIGRASKDGSSRALFARADNGYISSPVISRTHAELGLTNGPSEKGARVYIRDLKSMHGTFLNYEKIVPNVTYTIESGDTIQFGASVVAKPGMETFVAPRYKVEIPDPASDRKNRPQSPFGRTIYAPGTDDISSSGSESGDSEEEEDMTPKNTRSSSQANVTNPVQQDVQVVPETILQDMVDSAFLSDEEEDFEPSVLMSSTQAEQASSGSDEPPQSPHCHPDKYEGQAELMTTIMEQANKDFKRDVSSNKLKETSPELGSTQVAEPANFTPASYPGENSFAEPLNGRNIFNYIANNDALRCSQPSNLSNCSDISEAQTPGFIFRDAWVEEDPFSEVEEDSSEILGVEASATSGYELKYPDLKGVKLPSFMLSANAPKATPTLPSIMTDENAVEVYKTDAVDPLKLSSVLKDNTTKKSALSIKELINEKDTLTVPTKPKATAQKRKSHEISEDATVGSEASHILEKSTVADDVTETEVAVATSGVLPVIESADTAEILLLERPSKKSRFSYMQFAGGMVVGAVGAVAGLLALPENYFG